MKAKKIITISITTIAALMTVLSGLMKLSGNEELLKAMTRIGVAGYLPMLGIMEILFAALFVYPKTMKVGFVLLSCYFAGAMATELSHDGAWVNAVFPMALIWISAFLRDRSIFMSSRVETSSI